MARKKLPDEEKRKKLSITINQNMIEKLKITAEQQGISVSQIYENILGEK